jgi:hypothetical protein
MGKRKHHKLPHIVLNVIAEYKLLESGVNVLYLHGPPIFFFEWVVCYVSKEAPRICLFAIFRFKFQQDKS